MMNIKLTLNYKSLRGNVNAHKDRNDIFYKTYGKSDFY